MSKWEININNRIKKKIKDLPKNVKNVFFTLITEISLKGPVRYNFKNYGKLDKNTHHCHLKKGKPCYVCVWEVKDKTIKIIEVKYVGTHEKAPY